jgi:hypothetical protein
LRLEGLTRHPREFRVAPEDEPAIQPDAVAGPRAIKQAAGYMDALLMHCRLA